MKQELNDEQLEILFDWAESNQDKDFLALAYIAACYGVGCLIEENSFKLVKNSRDERLEKKFYEFRDSIGFEILDKKKDAFVH